LTLQNYNITFEQKKKKALNNSCVTKVTTMVTNYAIDKEGKPLENK
jgi:hypothetical protein